MKVTLIMKNGMSIDINDCEVLTLNGEPVLDNPEIVLTHLSEMTDAEELVDIYSVIKDTEGNKHTFRYIFKHSDFAWGYTHAGAQGGN